MSAVQKHAWEEEEEKLQVEIQMADPLSFTIQLHTWVHPPVSQVPRPYLPCLIVHTLLILIHTVSYYLYLKIEETVHVRSTQFRLHTIQDPNIGLWLTTASLYDCMSRSTVVR